MASKIGATLEAEATIEDLHRVAENGKAELVNGKVVHLMPTGGMPGYAGGEIFVALREYARRTRRGYAFPDNVGFVVNLPHRRSLSPDAAFHPGPFQGGQFLSGAPVFAAEVRSENDYGPAMELEMADRRADYFAACTQVVWDVKQTDGVPARRHGGCRAGASRLALRRGRSFPPNQSLTWHGRGC